MTLDFMTTISSQSIMLFPISLSLNISGLHTLCLPLLCILLCFRSVLEKHEKFMNDLTKTFSDILCTLYIFNRVMYKALLMQKSLLKQAAFCWSTQWTCKNLTHCAICVGKSHRFHPWKFAEQWQMWPIYPYLFLTRFRLLCMIHNIFLRNVKNLILS